MTTEQAKKLSEDAITRLMEALERGQSDALKNYLYCNGSQFSHA